MSSWPLRRKHDAWDGVGGAWGGSICGWSGKMASRGILRSVAGSPVREALSTMRQRDCSR